MPVRSALWWGTKPAPEHPGRAYATTPGVSKAPKDGVAHVVFRTVALDVPGVTVVGHLVEQRERRRPEHALLGSCREDRLERSGGPITLCSRPSTPAAMRSMASSGVATWAKTLRPRVCAWSMRARACGGQGGARSPEAPLTPRLRPDPKTHGGGHGLSVASLVVPAREVPLVLPSRSGGAPSARYSVNSMGCEGGHNDAGLGGPLAAVTAAVQVTPNPPRSGPTRRFRSPGTQRTGSSESSRATCAARAGASTRSPPTTAGLVPGGDPIVVAAETVTMFVDRSRAAAELAPVITPGGRVLGTGSSGDLRLPRRPGRSSSARSARRRVGHRGGLGPDLCVVTADRRRDRDRSVRHDDASRAAC